MENNNNFYEININETLKEQNIDDLLSKIQVLELEKEGLEEEVRGLTEELKIWKKISDDSVEKV